MWVGEWGGKNINNICTLKQAKDFGENITSARNYTKG